MTYALIEQNKLTYFVEYIPDISLGYDKIIDLLQVHSHMKNYQYIDWKIIITANPEYKHLFDNDYKEIVL